MDRIVKPQNLSNTEANFLKGGKKDVKKSLQN
jgi:hypothetical protein